ncbi:MAG: hypothetical protein JKY70_15450 [Mucilaginibacter sp.]|nr:hypothetical protein [Mucilaginibacter sp.]
MKKICQILLMLIAFLADACKKDESVTFPPTILAAPVAAKNDVETIAGGSYADGNSFMDGKGTAARFGSAPGGIFETSGHTLYFADIYNHAVRKITPDGVVTTLKLPPALGIYLPHDVYLGRNSALYVSYIKQDFKFYLAKIETTGHATCITVPGHKSQRFFDLEDDRANNMLLAANYPYFYKFSDSSSVGAQVQIKAGMIANDDYDPREGPSIQAIATSQTGDRYFTSAYGKHIYLKDSQNKISRVFDNFSYTNITSIAISANGKEVYITDDGSIKEISVDNKTITTLVKKVVSNTPSGTANGTITTMDSHVPLLAYADHLTISRDNKYLYFTSIADFSTTINKIQIH